MKKKQFKLGKTESGILLIVKERSDEETVIRTALGQGLAASTVIVSSAINRLAYKGLISRNSTKLSLTDPGKMFVNLLE